MKSLNVLKLGKSVQDPATVKRWTQRTNYFIGLLTSLVVAYNMMFPSNTIPSEIIDPAAKILGGIVVAFNLIMNAATSDKMGITGAIEPKEAVLAKRRRKMDEIWDLGEEDNAKLEKDNSKNS